MKLSCITFAIALALASAATLLVGPNASAATVADGSFESPHLFGGHGYAYNPTTEAGVTFSRLSGVQASGFGYAPAPDGAQTAFLQSAFNGQGSITQTVSGLSPGATYNVSFYDAALAGYDPDMLTVTLDGALLGFVTPTSTDFTLFTTASFVAVATTGTLAFTSGASLTADADTAIDAVKITELTAVSAAPEPSAWALVMVGVFGIGLALRRQAREQPRSPAT